MLTSEFDQPLNICEGLAVLPLRNLSPDFHQPDEGNFGITLGHLKVVLEELLQFWGLREVPAIQGKLVRDNQICEIVVHYHQVVTIFDKQVHKIQGRDHWLIL